MRSLVIRKENGRLVTPGADILAGIERMVAARGNGEYRLLVERVKEPRSLDQNRLLWLWLACISSETGNTPQELHDIYCTLFLRKTAYFAGSTVVTVSGTSGLTKAEFSAFLDKIQAHAAAELGIILPTPGDEVFAEFANEYRR